MLDIRRLQILKTLALEGTMTAAATKLHMTTSAVSQQLAVLEREAGLALLVRAGRNVRLTEAGAMLVDHYARIATEVEAAEANLKKLQTDVRGRLSISAFPSFCSTVLPSALMSLHAGYPRLELTVSDLEPFESVAQLRAGHIDVAVVDDLHDIQDEGLVKTILGRDEIILCLPGDRQVSTDATLSDFADERWILDQEGSVFEQFVRQTCRNAGFEPNVVANCRNLMAMLGLVRGGLGVALMSELNLGRETEDLVVRRVDPGYGRNIIVLHRAASRESPAIAAVVSELRKGTDARATA
ncbi:LysR family transcriptional regulator [Arthrobacter sp. MYb23]|uniref:LysR family transcriptional regulator n=1 Tax=unclassified Arthrobacter TaxID=235627 RepID=UPI000CFD6258|nr:MULTISPECIES: LysR family transcriptional regulator [unclassified Arthrobacter]PRB43388.1 LysR family transcriptional regulator [Arthrobacter sp. MYb51]PRB96956.1 LysR family transcriptional regulator [Arthrobacter sp. MYb23]